MSQDGPFYNPKIMERLYYEALGRREGKDRRASGSKRMDRLFNQEIGRLRRGIKKYSDKDLIMEGKTQKLESIKQQLDRVLREREDAISGRTDATSERPRSGIERRAKDPRRSADFPQARRVRATIEGATGTPHTTTVVDISKIPEGSAGLTRKTDPAVLGRLVTQGEAAGKIGEARTMGRSLPLLGGTRASDIQDPLLNKMRFFRNFENAAFKLGMDPRQLLKAGLGMGLVGPLMDAATISPEEEVLSGTGTIPAGPALLGPNTPASSEQEIMDEASLRGQSMFRNALLKRLQAEQ